MQPTFSLLNGLPYISGNALAYMSLSPTHNRLLTMEESIRLAFPDFADKFTIKPVHVSPDTPFGGHTLEFKDTAYETWFRLKYG